MGWGVVGGGGGVCGGGEGEEREAEPGRQKSESVTAEKARKNWYPVLLEALKAGTF